MSTADYSNIHRYLDEAFADIAMTPEIQDLKEEIRGNLAARVSELAASGMDANAAALKAVDELGDIHEIVAQFEDGDERGDPHHPGAAAKRDAHRAMSNDAYLVNRVRPKPAFVIRTVILSALVAASAVLIALAAFHVLAWPTVVLVLIAVLTLALPGAAIVDDSLRQETSIHFPLPAARSNFYAGCTGIGLVGLGLIALDLRDPAQFGLLIAGVVLAATAIIGFIWLGTTQTNRTKPWVRAAARQYQVLDRFSQDPVAAARFGIYTVVLWLLAFAAFVVLSITVGFAWSWLALLVGCAAFMFMLARMLFPSDSGDGAGIGDHSARKDHEQKGSSTMTD